MTIEKNNDLSPLKLLFEDNAELFTQKIADFFPAIIYVYETGSKKLQYINKRVTDVLGYSMDDVLSWDDGVMEMVFKDDSASVRKELEKFNDLKNDDSYAYNCRLNKKGGDWRYFKTLGTTLKRNNEGKVSSLLFIAQDITDQLQSEQEADAIKELLDDTEELLKFGSWTEDVKTNEIQWSNGLYKLLGYDKNEVKEKKSAEFFLKHLNPEEAAVLQKAIETAIKAKTEFEYQHNLKRKNGETIIVSTKGKIITDADGNHLKTVGIVRNISDQVQSHAELIEYRQRTIDREIFLECGSWEIDMQTNSMVWSEGMYRLFGYNPKTDMGNLKIDESFYERHMDREDFEKGVALRSRMMENASDQYLWSFQITTHDGVIKKLETYGKFIKNDEGKVLKVMGTTRDISQYHSIQRDLEEKIVELNRSNKELEDFAYIASHDLQEPLRKLTTFSERLTSRFTKELGDDGKAYTDRIMAATDNMRVLIDNLLEFSRVTRGQYLFEKVDLNKIVEKVKVDQELPIEQSGATISHDDLPVIEGIPAQLEQLFNNLINNSIKFRKNSIPIIRISARTLSKAETNKHNLITGRKWYEITIADNGIGFDGFAFIKVHFL